MGVILSFPDSQPHNFLPVSLRYNKLRGVHSSFSSPLTKLRTPLNLYHGDNQKGTRYFLNRLFRHLKPLVPSGFTTYTDNGWNKQETHFSTPPKGITQCLFFSIFLLFHPLSYYISLTRKGQLLFLRFTRRGRSSSLRINSFYSLFRSTNRSTYRGCSG